MCSNLAVTQTERCWELCRVGEMDEAMALLAPDFVHDDRRSGVRLTLRGPQATIAGNREALEAGFVPRFEVLAVEGDRLALARLTARTSAGFELVLIQVLEVDDAGLRTVCISFDEERIADARAEFEERNRGLTG